VTLSAADFPHGVGTYGLGIRGTKNSVEVPDSNSLFLPLRFAPARYQLPATPKIQAEASLLNGANPLFYDIADIEPGGSTRFGVTYDVNVSALQTASQSRGGVEISLIYIKKASDGHHDIPCPRF